VRIVIVDDHAVVRAGLRLLLEGEPGTTVVDEAATLADAVFKLRRHTPNMILLDVRLPDGDGVEAIGRLKAESPVCHVLVLSMEDDPHHVRQAFANGADGYLLKEAAEIDLLQVVQVVANGGRYLQPELGARVFAAEAAEKRRAAGDPLSEREREVLRLLAHGYTNQEIAKRLYVSVRTAETHRAHIMRKLRLSSRAELVSYAMQNGMLEDPASP
jgi:two-component system, NarL family, response regulator NreC